MAHRHANTDRISHLPSEIIEKILILLPCRDAVRTSILSSDWRYKWTSMSHLNFGGEEWGTMDKHVKFITQCLLHHQGPIRKFSVNAQKWPVAQEVEQWMKLVSKHDIEELQLVFGYKGFRSPPCLFYCKKLTHLELSWCLLDIPPTFEGFMNLKALKLKIIMPDRSSIDSLISKSPLLESICLQMWSCYKITISAPKIKYLSLRGDLKNIVLEKSPVLVDMVLCLDGDSVDSDVINILGGAPNLENLSVYLGCLYMEHFKFGICRGVLSTTFSYLKMMTLSEFHLGESKAIPLVIELLTSAPNLEKLVINNIFCDSLPNEADSVFWKKEYLVGHCFMKLKVVEMGYILSMPPEIEFVKFILSSSPVLEKMTIQTDRNKLAMTPILKELPTLAVASPQVVITLMAEAVPGENPTAVWTNCS